MKRMTPLKIVLLFLLASQLWIIFTDLVVAEIATTPHMFARFSMIKGGLYLAAAGLFLYWLISRYASERDSSEKIFYNLFNNSEVAMFRTRLDGSAILNANEKFFDLFGYSREDVIGKPSVILWADTKQRDEMVRLLKADGRVVDFECTMLTKNHAIRHCITSLTLYPQDEILEGSLIDITERKKTEESLRENQARLDLALQAAHMGVWRLEIKEKKRYYDELTCQIVGIDARTFGGSEEELFRVIHPDDREMVKTAISLAIEQGLPYELKYRVVWPEGSIHYVSSRGRLMRDRAGNPERFNGVIWDVTEQHFFQKELQEKEMKYRSLFESAKDGIFIVGETGFVDCNQRGAEMYGLSKEEIIGRTPSELAPEKQPDGRFSSDVAGEKVLEALSGKPQVLFEWQYRHVSGRLFDAEITLSGLELGGKRYVQAIVRDISERKRMEQEHVKTQKLESIGTLAGGIAHDFNNLLQGVFGYISLAKLKRNDPAKSLSALEEAEKALHMTVQLTNQLLTFSKGGMPVKKNVALQPIIENAAKFALSGSRVTLLLAFPDMLRQVEADEGQISQVIQNIVLNADQAMPTGGQVEVIARNVEVPGLDLPQVLKRGTYVEIRISDTGIGISEQYLDKIFDPYFTTKEKGSGLGLATSYSIIKNHNGLIDVRSEVGKGTVFLIYLPATADAERNEQPRSVISRARRKANILVMDDEQFILNLAKELLGELGHTVTFCANGNEAIQEYQKAQRSGHPFDAVILDLTIRGGMGGAETVKRLFEVDPNVKAIVSSGYSNDAAASSYVQQGFKAVLKKPYTLEHLQRALVKVLGT